MCHSEIPFFSCFGGTGGAESAKVPALGLSSTFKSHFATSESCGFFSRIIQSLIY